MTKTILLALALLLVGQLVQAQILHSHNDYRQKAPFTEAYAQGMGSIEADLFLRKGSEIVVCHDRNEVAQAPLFETLYLRPLLAQEGTATNLVLLIDFKDGAELLMQPLAELLSKHPTVFHREGVRVVISGSRPPKEQWASYADYIYFDGRDDETYSPAELNKVFMISQALGRFTTWTGIGEVPPADLPKVTAVIAKAHALGKPFRFWGCGDGPHVWSTLHKLGVDVINTDQVAACSDFFGLPKRVCTP